MDQQARKAAVAAAALESIRAELNHDTVIGIGTGSTANCFIDALAQVKHLFDGAVASSSESERRLREHGIPVLDLNAVGTIPICVDGADEVTREGAMIKGGGAALTREKIVAAAAGRFICIVDDSKLVGHLGAYPLPVEVIPMARSLVGRWFAARHAMPEHRIGVTTDNGNEIIDVHELRIDTPMALESDINDVPGVVTNGLFAIRGADVILVGSDTGVERIECSASGAIVFDP